MPKSNTNITVKNAARRYGYTKPTAKMRSGVGGINKNKKTGFNEKGVRHKAKISGSRNKLSPFSRPTWLGKKVQRKPDNVVKIDGKWIRKK